MNLYKETMNLLKNANVTKAQIAKEAKVSLRWLGYLASEEKPDYSVSKVQRVYDYLSKIKKE